MDVGRAVIFEVALDENEVLEQLEYLVARGEKSSVSEIARWAYEARLDSLRNLDTELLDLLDSLALMDMGPEFEWSREDLVALVDALKSRWKL
ncbi:hypothetical protein [Marinobacter sp. AN1]|uniref:hypothetical protein n=1 Tax=Marinobacter sp. AN1 TaxID=2886046 RepID=UPI002230207A|nr:hypothetical protein [Marinobacter sp. AN1]UZD66006.1 hypothetical protein LJ360_01170 [Marinobacter sp. AN1]